MADAAGKQGPHSASIVSDLKAMVPPMTRRRRTKVFAYGFVIAFVACTAFLAFSPSGNASPLRFNTLFTSSSAAANAPYRSQFDSLLSFFFPNSSSPVVAPPHPANHSEARAGPAGNRVAAPKVADLAGGKNQSAAAAGSPGIAANQTKNEASPPKTAAPAKNGTKEEAGAKKDGVLAGKQGASSGAGLKAPQPSSTVVSSNKTVDGAAAKDSGAKSPSSAEQKAIDGGDPVSNFTGSLVKGNGTSSDRRKSKGGIDGMIGCDIFHGKWVRDDSYPLYPEGSCPHIDESFDCFRNGRPDRNYQKLRWQPDGCDIPRLNATDMLERLRGKRLVFVGDSLNRNMWESLVCALRHAVKDKKNVFEASGNRKFRTEGSYSFMFKDYGCTIEFFRSPFLVQEWEVPDNNGTTKETLRLDIVEKSASNYKNAYVIVFNTGHWWTHEKTSKGKDYYQEGSHIYSELNVADAFHKALNTWAKWVDSNVNPKKTHVFFRGYSASHFRGGQWNSGGQCDREREPIKKEAYLSSYPPKMSILETVIKGMKTPVGYLNITRMTDYRIDAHPSIYRGHEEKAPDHIQDCSHWCLPGVPDSWNELLYAQLLIKQHQARH